MQIPLNKMGEFLDSDFAVIKPKLIIFQGYEKLSFYIGRDCIKDIPVVQLVGTPISEKIDYLKLHIKSSIQSEHRTQNVIGYVEGKNKDKFIVFSSHYDGLGMFGNVVFPGAQDNASGTAAVLDLASYFSKSENKPPYSVVFICFGAEEIGMLGSNYYVDNPLFPLEKISLVINLDLVGSGSGGINIVNGKKYEKIFNQLEKISNENYYFYKIIASDNRCNSDHCAFDKKNVPAFFLMTIGEEHKWSHSIYDRYDNLPFTKYESLFKLLRDFIVSYK
jgi:Zn-dependent M28 family amino/carboxypeptidase